MKNRNTLKLSLLLSFCLVLFIRGNAQEFKISGKLVDSASAKPVAVATINFQEPEKKISRTVVSDQNGAFQMKLVPGKYKVMITHATYRRKPMPLKVEGQDVDLGSIQLVAFVKNLGGVTVTAAKPLVEQQSDRLIYNVEEDPAAKSESASDILRKTPFVNVDGDGAIQVNGQTNFKVLLNGRETALFSQNVKDALKAFPGATISKIEVITSPSAKYDAEGVGGIINIITKKKLAGYNGTVNSNITTIGNRSAGFNFNLKTGKVGISAMYNVMSNPSLTSQQMAVTTPEQAIAFARRDVGGERKTNMFFNTGNLELTYDLDSTNTLVVYGNLNKHRNEQVNDYSIYTLFPNGNAVTDPYYLESRTAVPSHGFGTDYIRKYKGKPQKEFTVRFAGMFNTVNSFNASEQKIGSTDRFILNNSEAFNSEYTVQSDLIEPLNKTTRLEAGVKGILRRAHSDFGSQVKFNKTDAYQIDPTNSNKFSYDQDVYSAYASVNKNYKAFSVRLGLRLEHTRVDGDFTSTSTKVTQRYTNLIPNVLLTKQFSKTMNGNLTYTFRLGRPSIQSLNPFVNNSDSLFISYGNPNLGPQYIHSITAQYRIFKGSKFISFQSGFNFSNNLIIQNPTFNSSTGITATTGANAGQIRELTLGFVSNLPVKKWNFGVNATGRFARIRNSLQTDFFNTVAGNVNANISYKATPRFTITSNSGYFVPLRMPNSTFPDNYFYSLNLGYKMLKDKLTVTATFTNFFEEERKLRFATENDFFVTENLHTILFRNVGLGLTYNFGKLKEAVSKKKGVTNDDQVQ